MSCRETEPLLPAYHDGESPPGERAQVEEHLSTCAACREALEGLRRADAAAVIPDPGPDYYQELSRKVMETLAEETPEPAWIAPLRRPPVPFLRWGTLAAAAMVVLVAGGIWLEGKGDRTAVPTVTAPSPVMEEVYLGGAAVEPGADAGIQTLAPPEPPPPPRKEVDLKTRAEAAPAVPAIEPPREAEEKGADYSQAAPALRQVPVQVAPGPAGAPLPPRSPTDTYKLGGDLRAPGISPLIEASSAPAPAPSLDAALRLLQEGKPAEANSLATHFLAAHPEHPRAAEATDIMIRARRALGMDEIPIK